MYAVIPVIKSRFSKTEIEHLYLALKIIICERAGHVLNGHSKNGPYWRVHPHRYPSESTFDQELMDRTLALWSRLCNLRGRKGKSCRLPADEIEIWILMLAIRMARHQDRHTTPGRQPRPQWSRLLKKLDRLQRTVQRAWLNSEQAALYETYRSRWKKHQLWVRLCYGCLCRQPISQAGIQTRHLFVREAINAAKKALAESEIKEPPENELRRMVRMAFREIRRGRHPYSIVEVARGGDSARAFLAFFIKERLRKSGDLQFLTNKPIQEKLPCNDQAPSRVSTTHS